LIAEIRNLRPNAAKRLEAVAEVEKTFKADVQRKQFLNPLMLVSIVVCNTNILFL
jgi:hypothetical protein